MAEAVREPVPAPRYPNFDVLRLFLALGVVSCHAPSLTGASGPPTVWVNYVPGFLCVSGFLVLQSFEGSTGWKEFLVKRAWRIGPALVACLVMLTLWRGPLAGLTSLVIWLTGGHVQLSGQGNNPLWTLGYEEAFYGFLACFSLVGGYRRKWSVWLLLLVSVGISLWSDGRGEYVYGRGHLFPAFFAGNLLYLYRQRILALGQWWPTGTLLVTVLAKTALFPHSVSTPFNLLMPVLFVWWAFAGVRIPVPRGWPDLSYGVYLWHMPVLWWVRERGARDPLPVLFVGSLLAAAVSWALVENPVKQWRRRL